MDGDGHKEPFTLSWTINGECPDGELYFSGDFGGSSGGLDTSTDWVKVSAALDGGSETSVVEFRGTGGFNADLALDADLDGVGTTPLLTLTAQTFTQAISGALSSSMVLSIELKADSGGEEIALDNIKILCASDGGGDSGGDSGDDSGGDPSPSPPSLPPSPPPSPPPPSPPPFAAILHETFDDASKFTMVQSDGSDAEFFSDGSGDYVRDFPLTAVFLSLSHTHLPSLISHLHHPPHFSQLCFLIDALSLASTTERARAPSLARPALAPTTYRLVLRPLKASPAPISRWRTWTEMGTKSPLLSRGPSMANAPMVSSTSREILAGAVAGWTPARTGSR